MTDAIDDGPRDFPLDDMIAQARHAIDRGICKEVFQRFTCKNCGKRETLREPNVFLGLGTCMECGHVTNIRKQGCNFLVRMEIPVGAKQDEDDDRDRAEGRERSSDPG